MLEFNDGRDIFTVKSKTFEAVLAKRKGGTLRVLFFNGIDTGLKREGCEYWIDDKTHYEQEFGHIISLDVVEKTESRIIVNIKSTLTSPQKREHGGECEVEWIFSSDGTITTKSRIFPLYNVLNWDKYICFNPGVYTTFAFLDDNKEVKILNPEHPKTEWYSVKKDAGGLMIRNDKNMFNLAFGKHLNDCGIYTTKSMMEVKCKDHQSRYGEFSKMVITAL